MIEGNHQTSRNKDRASDEKKKKLSFIIYHLITDKLLEKCITRRTLAERTINRMKKIKVGSLVSFRPRGENILKTSKVVEIQICRNHDKMEGRPVSSCDLDKHKSVTISFEDGYWCWEDQIRKIH